MTTPINYDNEYGVDGDDYGKDVNDGRDDCDYDEEYGAVVLTKTAPKRETTGKIIKRLWNAVIEKGSIPSPCAILRDKFH
jgi:hypothetical protein